MGKVVAYLRTSTDRQDLNNQKLEILEYARRQSLHIDDFIAISISARKSQRERRLEEVWAHLHPGDTLVVTELSRLGRSTGEVIHLMDDLLGAGIRVVVIRQQLDLDKTGDDMQSLTMVTLFSLFAHLERMLISQRTQEALAAKKAQGVALGKPKGTRQQSIYDKDRPRIIELLQLGVSARHISTHHLGYRYPSSLSYYIKTRNLRAAAKS
jgi:DNA invertase Pin-like site-specific DNA recombinase